MYRETRPIDIYGDPRRSDKSIVARLRLLPGLRAARPWLFGAIAAACLAWPAFAAPEDDDELQPDINALRARAESGNVKAQTRLADFCIASDDFTNAVHWYRKAAEQDDVTAQLSLASLLMAGRGVAKNPQEAARWLRAAADHIEGKKPAAATAAIAPATNAPAPAPPPAIVISRTNTPPATNASPPASARPTNAVASVALSTNFTRVPRADALHLAEPKLQDSQPVLRPPGEGK